MHHSLPFKKLFKEPPKNIFKDLKILARYVPAAFINGKRYLLPLLTVKGIF
jgi:hypothetical protein